MSDGISAGKPNRTVSVGEQTVLVAAGLRQAVLGVELESIAMRRCIRQCNLILAFRGTP